jgi:hypothetical protein
VFIVRALTNVGFDDLSVSLSYGCRLQMMMDPILGVGMLVGCNRECGIRLDGAPTEACHVFNRTNTTCA